MFSESRSDKAARELVDVLLFANVSPHLEEEESDSDEDASTVTPTDLSALGGVLPLLNLCNRPLLWYVLTPLLNSGFTYFFVCVKEEDHLSVKDYLARDFPSVTFYFVVCKSAYDGVKGYLKLKRQLRLSVEEELEELILLSSSLASRDYLRKERFAMAGLERDCIFVNCDTILAGIDVGEFVNLFYSSLATVSGLFFRPAEKELVEDKSAEKGGKGKSHQAFTPAPFQYRYCSVAYDEEDVVSAMTTGAEQQNPSQCASEDRQRGLNHSLLQHRLYFMSPYDGAEAAISVAFAARRPNLTCTADVVDTGVYALRSWVLHFMDKSDEFDNDCTLQELALSPTILRSQHTQVNTAAGIYNTPDRKLHYTVPLHWMYNDKNESICVLNAANGIHLPARGDSVRVFATILEEKADIPRRVYRIDSLENYKSVSQELVLRKCYSLGLLEGAAPKKGAEVGLPKVSGVPPSLDPSAGGPPLSSFALAHLLRDNPITLKEKLGSLKLYISGSYLVTPVNPGCYVTNSIIGPGVRLGEGARVTNSIILRGAEIGEKAQILNSVVGAEAGVAANKTIRASVIGTWCQVEEDVTDEVILPNE